MKNKKINCLDFLARAMEIQKNKLRAKKEMKEIINKLSLEQQQ